MKVFAKKTLVALCILAFVVSGGLVYALNSLSFHQNPSVPGVKDFTTSPDIALASDQTALWTWNEASHQFTATIQITNNGNEAFTPTITFSSVPSGWTGSTSTLTSIAKDATATVTLYMTSTDPNPSAGPIGDFTVAIT